MLPKVAAALARALDPIKPVDRPGQSLTARRSSEGGEGGHGPLGYSGPDQGSHQGSQQGAEQKKDESQDPKSARDEGPPLPSSLPLQPGLTQVILELNAKRQELVAGSVGVAQYEHGAKDQKKASRMPKGSMLDKKAA